MKTSINDTQAVPTILKAQHKEMEANERFQHSFEIANIAICLVNLDGRFTLVNDEACIMFGYAREELESMTFMTITHPEDVDVGYKYLQRALSGEVDSLRITKRYMHKDEHTVWANLSTTIVRDAQKHPLYFISYVLDITKHRQVEEELAVTAKQLCEERESLQEKNIALRQVLDHLEEEKRSYKHEICESVEKLLMPVVAKLKQSGGVLGERDVDVLETTLMGIVEKDIDQFKSNMGRLSARELDICELIRHGESSKEIAEKLHISSQTVHKHRQQIRRKLQLSNTAVNLAAYLRSRRESCSALLNTYPFYPHCPLSSS